mgnify:CR=1 FL=1
MNRAAGNACEWDLSLIAWGLPSAHGTFSGYARHLAEALRGDGRLRREFSMKQMRPWDVLSGALRLGWHEPRVQVNRLWMWSEHGSRALTRRLNRQIRAAGDRGAFLQIGTQVTLDRDLGAHYVLTDMTIPQACRARQFGFGRFSQRRVDAAVEVQRGVLHDACHVFALSEWTKQSIVDDFDVDPSNVTVVYAGSNLRIDASLQQARNRREILFVGIDWERKGGPLLLEAFRIARQRLPDVTLSIVGCSPQVHDTGVVVEGFLDRRNPAEFERLSRCYLRAACMCLPSLFDPFPNAIIEAATAGLPTVAIDNGSRREAVIDQQTGILARSPDAEAIAEALVALLEDPARCEAMGREAQRRSETFTWAHVIARIGAVAASPGSDPATAAHHLQPVA